MKDLTGEWQIVEMGQWDNDYIDLLGPGFFRLDNGGTGEFRFGVVEATLDFRHTENTSGSRLEFTFEGASEFDPVSGRGWATVRGKTMSGHLYFHLGDDSSFKARRR